MGRVEYLEIQAKSALNRAKGMPFKWSLNPYGGCVHACRYCYARAFYATAGHGDAGRDFESRILVKVNFVQVLRRELGRRSWTHEQVAIGTSTDAFQAVEGRYRLARGVLEALLDFRTPVGIVTKSPLVLRDRDLLAELAKTVGARVMLTITTADEALARQVERGVASPRNRLRTVRALNEAGVPAGVLMAPVLPGLADSEASIDALACAAAEHGAVSFGANVLRLAPMVKEEYLSFVADAFPDLLPRYERAYTGVYAPRAYVEKLEERVERIRTRYGFGHLAMGQTAHAPENVSRSTDGWELRGEQLRLPLDEGHAMPHR